MIFTEDAKLRHKRPLWHQLELRVSRQSDRGHPGTASVQATALLGHSQAVVILWSRLEDDYRRFRIGQVGARDDADRWLAFLSIGRDGDQPLTGQSSH
ncbi:MAG: hypothetical protein NZM04_09280 [Methylacidiphilales bacterium]|nr:hypothetical protein [Candidatus Methylacidiphilales bacterium]